jgi:YkoP domain
VKSLIRHFDRFLRRTLRVFEFCDDPECLWRVRVTRVAHPLYLPDGQVPSGATVVELHLWNEHVPRLPPAGPDLGWAVQSQRRLVASLRTLARQMRRDPRLADVKAVCGITVLFFPGEGSGGEKLFKHLGFTLYPCHNPLGRFGEFFENLYTWCIMWTFNAVSLRQRRLRRLRRSEFWMLTDQFLRRYGAPEAINPQS